MTTRYRVEYALKVCEDRIIPVIRILVDPTKTHRRDQFIEWIKGLLAVPFVLHSQPTTLLQDDGTISRMAKTAHQRYAEIMLDVEQLIKDHISSHANTPNLPSKLKLLVPTIGTFFTPLALHDAFVYQDGLRRISSRRFVAPSFNDLRVILNTAQIMSLVRQGPIEMMTFDGDVTLYDDGDCLTESNPVIPRLLALLQSNVKIGIVTAAGYEEAEKYYDRLYGLLNAVHDCKTLTRRQKSNLIIMGGEANYLFRCNVEKSARLEFHPRKEWLLDDMRLWAEKDIDSLLDLAECALKDCALNMNLDAQVLRKERAVGIIPKPGKKFAREQLEETVLVTQRTLEMSPLARKLPFCAFNGGNDVFVDIGDKSWGVLACQKFFGGVSGSKSLHIGDQFLSAGANDFKARLACTTAWIANPDETVRLLDEISELSLQTTGKNGEIPKTSRKRGRPNQLTDETNQEQVNENEEMIQSRKRMKSNRAAAEDDLYALKSTPLPHKVRTSKIGAHMDEPPVDQIIHEDIQTNERNSHARSSSLVTEAEAANENGMIIVAPSPTRQGKLRSVRKASTIIPSVEEPSVKRGRGRPPKDKTEAKRGPGRPRKSESPVKRGPGRPRKNSSPLKGKVGRPPKNGAPSKIYLAQTSGNVGPRPSISGENGRSEHTADTVEDGDAEGGESSTRAPEKHRDNHWYSEDGQLRSDFVSKWRK